MAKNRVEDPLSSNAIYRGTNDYEAIDNTN